MSQEQEKGMDKPEEGLFSLATLQGFVSAHFTLEEMVNALNAHIKPLREKAERLEAELESHSWEISPAMAQAALDAMEKDRDAWKEKTERESYEKDVWKSKYEQAVKALRAYKTATWDETGKQLMYKAIHRSGQ